ncbi:MAG TPA: GNAT family N-acetyltransferase [Steroidobacteraceae bacterium]|nr:GNAT family N-acetyltransferase [Steroidobacteraceae bacterium]
MTAALRARTWSESEFATSRSQWQELLETSPADPLFMSWDWQWRWWVAHARDLAARLQLLAFYDNEGKLVGLAPFYAHRVRRLGIASWRLELLGNAWRRSDTAFSEYLDLIAAGGYAEAVLTATADWLAAHGQWSDIALTYVKPDSLALRLAREHLQEYALVREVEPARSSGIRLRGDFAVYLGSLSSGARRKLYNQRRKLRAPEVAAVPAERVATAVEQLHRMSRQRWGTKSESLRAFLTGIAQDLARLGRLHLTVLREGGNEISVLYVARVGNCDYYLQSAFDAAATRGLSPGYLHLGYAIESAYAAGVDYFDFLAGAGRHRDYKQDLANEHVPLVCLHGIRPGWLQALYRLHGRLQGRPRTVRQLVAGATRITGKS